MRDAGAPGARRVALLARPGAAADRVREALDTIGIVPVIAADPLETDPDTLAGASPDVLVVVLDPAVEDALERFDAMLADSGVDVLFEEADLVVAREGWDAARWSRHLSAKLLGTGDVLPPGTEPPPAGFVDAMPAPGRPPSPAQLAEPALDSFDVAGASDLADAIPAGINFDPVSAEFDPVAAEFDGADTPPASDDAPVFAFDAYDAVEASDDAEPPRARKDENVPEGLDSLTWLTDDDAPAKGADTVPNGAAAAAGDAAPAPSAGTGGLTLSLADPDDLHAHVPSQARDDRAPAKHDLAEIERRIASLELATEPDGDVPAGVEAQAPAGTTDASGAVLVFAGIGGPDAVRQFIGGLPAGFPKPVLIQQRLDGARHDRLVQQMARATELPVELAEAGNRARAGTIYILPPAVTVAADDAGIAFAEGDAADAIAALPAGDSAVLLFSGSDAGLVDAAMRLAGDGGLVAGQSPDDCYDAAAAQAVVASGGRAGPPAELAQQLVARWNA
jgi:chemosensory pili system protein ChpB (putative protein-glutamate methylesterase)